MNLALLKTKIEDSRQRVGAAETDLETALHKLTAGGETTVMATLLEHAFATLREARRHLADLTDLLAGEAESPRPAERNCPACEKVIRANARICGYCWRRLSQEAP